MPYRKATLAAVLVLIAAALFAAAPYVSATALVLDLSGSESWLRRALPVRVQDLTVRDLEVPTRYGAISARAYLPHGADGRSLIVFPGIHAGGVDEPRLAAFSRRLAATGLIVVSVPLPELRRYRVTTVSTDMIEDAAVWLTREAALAPRGRITMAGVSFAGGLAIVASGRPSLAGKVDSVVSFGGHADLPRVMAYLCTGRLPDGTVRAPNDYGSVVVLFAAIPKLVPANQIDTTRAAVSAFLDASSVESTDRPRSVAMFADARRLAEAAPEPARHWLRLVNDRDVPAFGPPLLPYIEELGGAAGLSPDRSPAARVPVFLLHGADDNVIPSAELPLLERYLHDGGNARVRALLTPVLSHADVRPATLADDWRLIQFWKGMLAASK